MSRHLIRDHLTLAMNQGVVSLIVLLLAAESPARAPITASEQLRSLHNSTLTTAHAGVRRALVICGHPGDRDHRKLYAETIEKLYAALTQHHGFATDHVQVVFGGEASPQDGPALKSVKELGTREVIEKVAAELRGQFQPDDSLWLIVLGHAHYDGRYSWFNLPGPDVNQLDFAKLFSGLTCREQVFWITTPVSGFYLKPLSAAGRIVITATEADLEVNETIFHQSLAKYLGNPPPPKEFDVDHDGLLTILDLYVTIARDVAQTYATEELLATEHSLLEDNADGRGTELQIDYLPIELGGRATASAKPPKPTGDGVLAARVRLLHSAAITAEGQP